MPIHALRVFPVEDGLRLLIVIQILQKDGTRLSHLLGRAWMRRGIGERAERERSKKDGNIGESFHRGLRYPQATSARNGRSSAESTSRALKALWTRSPL